GGDHRLARLESVPDQVAGGFETPDQLDHDVDVGVGHEPSGVGGQQPGGDMPVPGPGEVAHRDPAHLEVGAALDDEVGGTILENPDEGGTDIATPEDGDPDDLFGQ